MPFKVFTISNNFHGSNELYQKIESPILSVTEINYRMSAMIIAEIGSFKHFDSYDKILVSPSIHQSEQLDSTAHPEKLCPHYLRYVLYNVAKYAAVGIRHLPNIYLILDFKQLIFLLLYLPCIRTIST